MGFIDFIKDILRPGNGVDYPKPGDMVTVHYHGYLYDPARSRNRGRRYVPIHPEDTACRLFQPSLHGLGCPKFDSSIKRGFPFTFKVGVGQVIKGWDVGILGMSLGERAYLTFGPHYGYGEKGAPPFIPGNSTLVFDVQLLAINGRGIESDESE